MEKGLLFVLSAPAGTGKSTIVDRVEEKMPNVKRCITMTTRSPREKEKEGVDYFFCNKEEFEAKIEERKFLEYAKVFENYYGTLADEVEKDLGAGKHLFLVIDTQGAKEVKKKKKDAILIFLLPPSMQELEKRLRKRKSENEGEKKQRLSWAKREIEQSKDYDYNVINDDLEKAVDVLQSIVIAEIHRVR